MVPFFVFIVENELLQKYARSDDYRVYMHDIRRNFDSLRREHPFEGGTVYRGLNFRSPKEYLEFRRSIKNGYMESDQISSWGRTLETGQQFARSPQVFQVTASVLSQYDPLERVNGFVGIVVAVEVGANVGIRVDYAEDEVILPPGRYKIKETIIEKKWKHMVSKIDINAEVLDILANPDTLDYTRLRALFRYKGGDLFDEVRVKIIDSVANVDPSQFKVFLTPAEGSYFASAQEKTAEKLLFPDGTFRFGMRLYTGLMEFLEERDVKRLITPTQINRIRSTFVKAIDKATKPLSKKKARIIYEGNAMNYLATYFGITLNDFRYLKEMYSGTYTRFNQELRKWNRDRHFNVETMTRLLTDTLNSPFRGY